MNEINVEKYNEFCKVYGASLREAAVKYPNDYGHIAHMVETVVERMTAAIKAGTYNHDGRAFKMTCKALGIPYTRKAIEGFIRNPVTA